MATLDTIFIILITTNVWMNGWIRTGSIWSEYNFRREIQSLILKMDQDHLRRIEKILQFRFYFKMFNLWNMLTFGLQSHIESEEDIWLACVKEVNCAICAAMSVSDCGFIGS